MKPLQASGVVPTVFAVRFRSRLAFVVPVLLAAFAIPAMADASSARESDTLWRALASDQHVALLRHAIAPGTGDPKSFTLGDCTTQRNLSPEGRAQAARIGQRFRDNGITSARVYASEWCRTRETAGLLQLGAVEALPALNSFFASRSRAEAQTRALTRWMAHQDLSRPLVLVTHQVNITALTGVYPASGELVIVRLAENGTHRVVGTIKTE
jgi:phosphohistidine phosphatase SixA